MNVVITPKKLSGTVASIPSREESHRKLICAALTAERFPLSKVNNIQFSEDISATLCALKSIGACCEVTNNSVIFHGFSARQEATIDCHDSRATIMLMLPLVCFFSDLDVTFKGNPSLLDSEFENLIEFLKSKGISIDYKGEFPFTVKGQFPSGECYVDSYSNISGLILSLAHNHTDSMVLVSNKDSSKAFTDMTAEILREAGILTAFANGIYIIRGGQPFGMLETEVGGDFLLSSNFVIANAMSSNIKVTGLDAMSPQPERSIFEIVRKVQLSGGKAFSLDASDFIDLVPILSVYACYLNGTSRISGIKRDFDDCSELIRKTCAMINAVGGKATAFTDAIEIEGIKKLKGGVVDAEFDFRIALAAAIMSTLCQETVTIKRCGCILRYYPTFFDDFRRLGGVAEIEYCCKCCNC